MNNRRRDDRLTGRLGGAKIHFLCLLLAGFLLPCAIGCGQKDYPAPQLEPPLPAEVQTQGIALVEQFVADINSKDFAAADTMLMPAISANWSPEHAPDYMKTQGYWMLVGSRDWKYNQVQGLKHGKEMVVHAQFLGPDANLYHTNFSFTNDPGAWKVEFILNPVMKTKPMLVKIPGPMVSGSR